MKNLRKIFSGISLLLIFCFPFVMEGIHQFSHATEFSCHVESEKHIHSEIHHCQLCDFAGCDNVYLNSDGNLQLLSAFTTSHTDILFQNFFSIDLFSSFLRGPPVAFQA